MTFKLNASKYSEPILKAETLVLVDVLVQVKQNAAYFSSIESKIRRELKRRKRVAS